MTLNAPANGIADKPMAVDYIAYRKLDCQNQGISTPQLNRSQPLVYEAFTAVRLHDWTQNIAMF